MSPHLEAVKQVLTVTYLNAALGRAPTDQVVETLSRLFLLKQKPMANIAAYVDREVARGKDLHTTLTNVAFFAGVLVEYLERDGNQPIVK